MTITSITRAPLCLLLLAGACTADHTNADDAEVDAGEWTAGGIEEDATSTVDPEVLGPHVTFSVKYQHEGTISSTNLSARQFPSNELIASGDVRSSPGGARERRIVFSTSTPPTRSGCRSTSPMAGSSGTRRSA